MLSDSETLINKTFDAFAYPPLRRLLSHLTRDWHLDVAELLDGGVAVLSLLRHDAHNELSLAALEARPDPT